MLSILSISMTSGIEICDLCGKSSQEAESLFLQKAKKSLKVESSFSGKVTKSRTLATGKITYDNPIEKKEDLMTEINLFLTTMKKHSAEGFILKDLYIDYSGYFNETPLLKQLLAGAYKRSPFDEDDDFDDFDDFDRKIINSKILDVPAKQAIEDLRAQLMKEIAEHKDKNMQGKTQIEAMLDKSIKKTSSKISMVKTFIKIPLEEGGDLKYTLEKKSGLKIENIEFFSQYNIPYLTLELNLCWVCSQLFASTKNKEFSIHPFDYHE